MDPDATLKALRDLTHTYHNAEDFGGVTDESGMLETALELVGLLDEWLSKGGFLPAPWAVGR